MVVLDTSALLFWALDSPRLSRNAANAIEVADRIIVSSMSIWEIGIKVGKGRLDIPLPVRDFAEGLNRIDRVEVVPVDLSIWLRNLELDWAHRDPTDRTIVATADVFDCGLVTSDTVIGAYYSRAIW